MERPLDILINDLEGEVRDKYMIEAEFAYEAEMAMQEGMHEPIKVSGLGRPFPDAHGIKKACSGVSSPRFHVTTK